MAKTKEQLAADAGVSLTDINTELARFPTASFENALANVAGRGQAPTTPISITPAPITTLPDTGFVDPATEQATPAGIGIPEPTAATGAQILNEEDLQAKRDELGKAGVPEERFGPESEGGGGFISKPDAQGKLFFKQPATLTSPDGKTKKVVASGSAEASRLLAAGFTLGDQIGGGTVITSPLLADEATIDTGIAPISDNGSLSDQTLAGVVVDIKAAEKTQTERNLALLTPEPSDLSRRVDELLGGAEEDAGQLVGRGALQLSEEERRGIEAQQQAIGDQIIEINKKVAEINTLTASFNQANVAEEGRPQTLSSLRGEQARNERMFLAQKNSITAEAGFLQAELLGMQGKLAQAQAAADRAVQLEFMDREASFNAKLNQLSILLPQLEKDEARYAQAVQLTLQQQQQALVLERATRQEIQNITFQAISSGITDPDLIAQMSEAQTVEEAQGLLAQGVRAIPSLAAGSDPNLQFISGTANQPSGVFNKATGEFIPFANLSGVDGITTQLTPDQTKTAISLSGQLKSHPMYTDMLDINSGMQGVIVGLDQENGFGDIAAINAFQRMIDPGATVREGDVALLQSASAFIEKYSTAFWEDKLKRGDLLPPSVREQMLTTAEELYEVRAGNYNETVGNQFKILAEGSGIPFKFVGQDFPLDVAETNLQGQIEQLSFEQLEELRNDPLIDQSLLP